MNFLDNVYLYGVALICAAFTRRITAAPTSDVVCSTDFQWMTNSKSQDPCIVYAYLSALCTTSNTWHVFSLNGTATADYLPPVEDPGFGKAWPSPCQCNRVSYALIQACAACQGSTISDWKIWTQNCPPAYITSNFPYDVPSATDVSPWVYVDMTGSSGWNVTRAGEYAASPQAQVMPATTPIAQKPAIDLSSLLGGLLGGLAGCAILAIIVGIVTRTSRPPRFDWAGGWQRPRNHIPSDTESDRIPLTSNPEAQAGWEPGPSGASGGWTPIGGRRSVSSSFVGRPSAL